ncbi:MULTISPECIES: winged helix-turn-helix domain-containing protein [Lysobacteraceae]|uniref:Winged helix-turn-helix domain-containing protein n=1 Tax=Novilysobacter avium TaxID=2781023 RepID=A0A7S6ZVV6_9GAMM|nr:MULTISPECIES: winged helix-turn-helix domain-containing protein [Lysobacter]QOW22574.1 winged helix-turn-helix domain-containing protein [Lysobacter avium]QOW25087.1 winged helix-turn-helix domain-containing protein [Lysobacter sp. H23M47]
MLPPDASPSPERLRIGQCTVDVLSREIHAPGARRPFRVTPKAMAVLLVLVDSADRVVSRETLLEQVWPDTLPSDDVLTQAVTQLRKAFQEVRSDPRYIETIAKGGYRLLASVENPGQQTSPVETGDKAGAEPVVDPSVAPNPVAVEPVVVADDPSDVPAPQPPTPTVSDPAKAPPSTGPDAMRAANRTQPRSAWRGWPLLAAAFLILALALIAVWWLTGRQTSPTVDRNSANAQPQITGRIEPFLITSAPGFELAPTLSPGGGLVAYMAIPPGQRNIAIMMQTTAPVAPRQLTFPEGMAEDSSPQWSPEGRDIAFLRITPGEDCRFMVVRATGRGERTVGTCDPDRQPDFSWTPEGDGFILDHGSGPGLQVLDLASGELRAIEYDADPDRLDSSPRYSPDGRWIVFLRNAPLADFWRIPAAGGNAERLTRMGGEILGWEWLPDNSGFVYARRSEGVSHLFHFDIASGNHVDLGVEDAEQPAVARNVASIAYVLRHARFGIYRFSGTGEQIGGRLFASSGRDRVPSIAPDGRQLVFASDRAGPFGLWWGDVEDPASLRMLEGIQPDSRQPAAWSSDSKRVVLVGSQRGAPPGSGDPGVFEVFTDSGRITRLPVPVREPVQVAFAPGPGGPDQRLLVLADRGDGRLRLSLFADPERPDAPLASVDDVTRIQVDAPRDRVIFSRLGDSGLWQADPDLRPESIRPVQLQEGLARWQHAWAAAGDGGTYLVRRTPGCQSLLIHDRGGDGREVCLDADRRAATRAFTFNPRSGQLFITLAEVDGGDIGFATLDGAE